MPKIIESVVKKGISSPEFIGDIPVAIDLDEASFVFRHYVAWGDCDPAQIAYTAHIPRWGLLAIEHWYRSLFGYDWYTLNMELGIGTPFVSLKFDFVAPVKPPEPLEIFIKVAKTGNSSITHEVEGYQQKKLNFTGETVAVFVDATTMTSIPIPANIKICIDRFVMKQQDEHRH